MLKETMFQNIDGMREEMTAMADDIFDHPEIGLEEHHAAQVLTGWLEKEGFAVERGVAGVPTAFRAIYKNGEGGPNIGLLCEYDALPGIGHACGHHMQGPSILAAAKALKDADIRTPYTVTVYGTPAEESVSGKIMMIQNGCDFTELDVAFMMHGGPATQVDVKSLANNKYKIIYHGVSSHAAIKPEKGRSALDGLILAFQGIEFLREHVNSDVKIHYTINNCGGTPANVVPAYAEASAYVRSYNRAYLDTVCERFEKVLKGAAMMTETEVEIIREKAVDNKIPVLSLNDLVMEQAKEVEAPRIRPAREKTGSTDFGNVMRRVPGTCARIAFVDENAAAHSQEYIEAGKTQAAHDAVIYGAKIIAGAALELIEKPELLEKIQKEFHENLERENAEAR
ncbi:MAG TPA: M20 family metallopeptidase [Candidatus Copromonas faecavium]|uniref:Peptidase M20 domain-containing protein 2 n=1 Tax=Candidatus Copromonas faecavium (nom. illeg.) TaxID=2840740 RepID=A0A9D1A3W5_9FIRM|nr:M20 family metallopeptidase [Candidatus Copromonas faecavium]